MNTAKKLKGLLPPEPPRLNPIPVNEEVEVRNETKKPILVSICRSTSSGRLYIHIGKVHGDEVEVMPENYAIIEVKKVKW